MSLRTSAHAGVAIPLGFAAFTSIQVIPMIAFGKGENAMASKKKTEQHTGKQSLVLYVHDLVYMLSAIMLVFLIFFRGDRGDPEFHVRYALGQEIICCWSARPSAGNRSRGTSWSSASRDLKTESPLSSGSSPRKASRWILTLTRVWSMWMGSPGGALSQAADHQ